MHGTHCAHAVGVDPGPTFGVAAGEMALAETFESSSRPPALGRRGRRRRGESSRSALPGPRPGPAERREGSILVVDDDPEIRHVVSLLLSLGGYKVRAAADGQEALEAVSRWRPSLVLLDLHMPVLDGPGVARRLRERGMDLPLVVMTSAAEPGIWAERIGAKGWLGKPFTPCELLAAVERVLAGRHPSEAEGL